jgi:membrane protein YqaA with SNARE-associated domain
MFQSFLYTSLFLICFVAACVSPGPEPVLGEDKIARIMADFHVADAATNGTAGYKKDSLTRAYYDQILKIHGVSREEYEQNLRVLVQDMARTKRVLEKAQDFVTDSTVNNK